MSKISMVIIAFYVITSSNFVIASDASTYEDYMLRIAKKIQEIDTLPISSYSKEKYQDKQLDKVADIATAYLGESALHKLRTIRNWVEVAPFRGQIVAIETENIRYSNEYKLMPENKLNAGYISKIHSGYSNGSMGYDFYTLLKAGGVHSRVGIIDRTIEDGSVKIRTITLEELLGIRRAIIAGKAVIAYERDGGLEKVEKQIASAAAIAAASSEDLK